MEQNGQEIKLLREALEDRDPDDPQAIIDQRTLDGILETAPERDYAIDLCVRAWNELDTCRSIGMEAGAIPWTAIAQWCDWHADELDRDAALQLIDVIRQIDKDRADRRARERALNKMIGDH